MTLTDAFTEFLLAKDHTEPTRAYYRERLGQFMRWCEAEHVTTVEGITALLVRRYIEERRTIPSQATGRIIDSYSLHSTVRGILAWLNWLAEEGLLDANVPKRIKPPRREQKVLRVLDKRQIERLFLAAEMSPNPARDKAILAVLLDAGIRARELCGIERRDVSITPDDGFILVRHGKGRRQREVPLGRKARLLLARWLRAHSHDAVFVGKGAAPLTVGGLNQVLYGLYERAGRQHFEGLKRGAHVFRHTFAVRFIEAGGDVYRLSRLMGHSQITTTEVYLRAVTARQARERSVSPLDNL